MLIPKQGVSTQIASIGHADVDVLAEIPFEVFCSPRTSFFQNYLVDCVFVFYKSCSQNVVLDANGVDDLDEKLVLLNGSHMIELQDYLL